MNRAGTLAFALLFARSQSLGAAVGAMAIVWACGVGWWAIVDHVPRLAGPYQVLLPAVAATSLGLALWSPMPEIEGLASRSLRRWHLVQTGVLLGLGGLVLTLPTPDGEDVDRAVVRNLLAYGGLSLLGRSVLGARLSWLPPITLAILTFVSGDWSQTGPVEQPLRSWPSREGDDTSALVISGALALAGLVALLFGRDQPIVTRPD